MARVKDLSDFERRFIVGTWVARASVTKTAQLDCIYVGTVTKLTSGFRSMVGNCGRQRTFDDHDACALVQYLRENRRLSLPQKVSARAVL